MNATMREKRVAILQKINSLIEKCNCVSSENNKCPNCKEIRRLGDELMRLKNKNKSNNEVQQRKERKEINITKTEYKQMKKRKETDVYIALKLEVSQSALLKWKKRNGLIDARGRRKSKEMRISK